MKPVGSMVYSVTKGADLLPIRGLKFPELKKKLKEAIKKELEWTRHFKK